MSCPASLCYLASAVLLGSSTSPTLAIAPPFSEEAAVVRSLVACRKLPQDAARLACYDRAAEAFSQAQVKGDVVVIDREQVRAVRRQAFGFHLPTLDLLPHAVGEVSVDRIAIEVASAGRASDGKWSMLTTEGAQWVQTDSEEIYYSPHAGSRLAVRSGALGSFFCKVDGQIAFRCQRRR